MRPDDHELDEEIRGHLALSMKERIDRGEDPAAARLGAIKEFGNLTLTRDSIRGVWRHQWLDAADALARDIRFAVRALARVKGMALTVIVTLALGIGANAAIFSVVRGVLLRPLVNRDEDRLLYIRQSSASIDRNLTFSVPEIKDLKHRVTTIAAFGEFSTLDFTLVGLGLEPRIVKAGVVDGAFFEVMGLRPVFGRLLNARDDGPEAASAAVLTYRFWSTTLNSDPNVVGKTVRLGPRTTTIVGVLEPSVPYPADTEIIANVVTSPHHLGATMVTSRTHRMTELFGRLAPGTTIEAARAELSTVHAAMVREHPESYSNKAMPQLSATRLRDQIAAPARTILIVLLAAAAVVFVIACSNVANLILARSVRREGELAVRAALGAGTGALRRTLLAESLVLCGAGALVGVVLARPLVALVASYAARFSVRALDGSVSSPPRRSHSRSCCWPAPACCWPRWSPCRRRRPGWICATCWRSTCRHQRPACSVPRSWTSTTRRRGASARCRVWKRCRSAARCHGATAAPCRGCSSPSRATHQPTAKRTRLRASGSSRRASST
jgi:hypothetical protein